MKNIFLIDDSKMDNYISEYIINESNIVEKTNVFSSPIEALAYLRTLESKQEEFPGAILLDVNMPDMNGFGFLDEFSNFPAGCIERTSVFMLTSSAHEDDVKRALKYPVVKGYFVKPLTGDILNQIISRHELSSRLSS